MRVLFDHQVFSLQDRGGASRYHYELLRYLSGVEGVEAELFLGLHRADYPFSELASPRITVPALRAPVPRGLLRYALNEALQIASSPLRGRFDVYHPTYYRRMPTVRARRVVTTHHDCTYELFPELFHDAAKVIRRRRSLFAQSDVVICISEASRRSLLDFYPVDPGRTRVVYHGVSQLIRSQPAAAKLRALLRRNFLLYVGGRHAYKNFDRLLAAFHSARLNTDYDLLAVGGGPLTTGEAGIVARLGLGNSVICIPEAPDSMLAEAYAAATLFVYPSLSEGFGMPPLEAMSAGCPVATSRVTAIPEVCGDAPFYFDPADTGSIANALTRAVSQEEERRTAIARGRAIAAGYRWEKCGAETLAVYRDCR